jgi:WD40 repeat protein/DNA-binding XRE family transcriptional regulator
MVTSQATESFRDLLLRYRGRSGLTQRQLAERVGIHRRTIQEWEFGASYPSAERLESLIGVLLAAGGLSSGCEAEEAQALWAAVVRHAPRSHAPFDQGWFAGLLATPAAAPAGTAPAATPRVLTGGVREPGDLGGHDWADAPDTTSFVGRTDELQTLRNWVLDGGGRVLAILGMGGIGKTMLSARLAQEVAPTFERVYWRGLRDAPPVGDWIAGAIGFLSDLQLVPPAAESGRLTTLMQLLRERRCLLVLDNFDSLFEPGQSEEQYRTGLEGYGRVLETIGAAAHQSCLVLTSREAPLELAVLGGAGVRTFTVSGLRAEEAQVLLGPKQLAGTSEQWTELVARFGGNGLALKVVGETIRELFDGNLGAFLDETGASSVFGGIRRLLAEQVERTSPPGQQVLRMLAVSREPVALGTLLEGLSPRRGRGVLLDALQGLRRRSLVERAETPGSAAITLQSVMLEYVTDRLVEAVADEIVRGQPDLLVEQPVIQARAKEYVRQSQERLIGEPILARVRARAGSAQAAERLLLALLEGWRGGAEHEQGYGPGNAVNLLRLLRGDLRGLDLSRLSIREAYLQEVEAQDASLAGASLAAMVMGEAIDFPTGVALSADGAYLAAGTITGDVCLWRTGDRTPLLAERGHRGGVKGVALSADGQLLASGSYDRTVRLWESPSGRPLATLEGHAGGVWGVAVSADGTLVASGSIDGTARLWEAPGGRLLRTLEGHAGAVWDVALSGDGRLVASGGEDGSVRLWEAASGQQLGILTAHGWAVWQVALSEDGQVVAGGSMDGTVRLWDTSSQRLLATVEPHAGEVEGSIWFVALSADGRLVARGSPDGTVRLWEMPGGRPLAVLQGDASGVRGVALSGDGRLVANGSVDGSIRLWETPTGRLLTTLQGHTNAVLSVGLSADGTLLAGASQDGTVRLWEAPTGRMAAALRGQTGRIRCVALSADGSMVASGGFDGTVQLWECPSGRPLAPLHGHTGAVWSVALSADGRIAASGSLDGTVRLWDMPAGRPIATLQANAARARGIVWGVALSADGSLVAAGNQDGTVRLWETLTGQLLTTLRGHASAVWSVALSADGRLVASGSIDGTVRLWEAQSGRLLAALEGQAGGVWAVALSGHGRGLASGGFDGTVKIWEVPSGQPLAILEEHRGGVWGVAVSGDGDLFASGSFDGTIKLWAPRAGASLRTLRADRRYERMDVTGLTGVTQAQRSALFALGAVDRDTAAAPTLDPLG